MREVTKSITLNVKNGGIAIDGYGNTRAGFLIIGGINRIDYGVVWNAKNEHAVGLLKKKSHLRLNQS